MRGLVPHHVWFSQLSILFLDSFFSFTSSGLADSKKDPSVGDKSAGCQDAKIRLCAREAPVRFVDDLFTHLMLLMNCRN
jgi:hypothetical protein